MPVSPQLRIQEPETIVLVELCPCDLKSGPGKLRGMDIHLYSKMKSGTEIVDLMTVECLAARVYWDRSWVVFDRSGDAARAVREDDDRNEVQED